MKKVDERTIATWSFRQQENVHGAHLSSRESLSSNVDDNSPRHFSTKSTQIYTGSQQNHESVHGIHYSTTNVYQSQHKHASNPFASALADAFGIEEAYS